MSVTFYGTVTYFHRQDGTGICRIGFSFVGSNGYLTSKPRLWPGMAADCQWRFILQPRTRTHGFTGVVAHSPLVGQKGR
jgi:hypothetical protein